MSSKDESIRRLEEEVIAARKTILALTKAVERLSQQTTYRPPTYVYPYRYVGPYWTYTVSDVTYTSQVGDSWYGGGSISSASGTTTNTLSINKGDDDDGTAVRAAV